MKETIEKTDRGTRESHESYGMVRFARVSGGRSNLFGSSITHTGYIELQICNAVRERHLNTDWYHADNRPLITVKLSANQFAELLTSLNVGSGVPCTIDSIGGKRLSDCPERNFRQEVRDEMEDRMAEATATAEAASKKLDELTKPGGTVKKSELRKLAGLLQSAICEIKSNVPFAHECFNEACDKTVAEAKSEIDASVMTTVTQLGLEKLAETKELSVSTLATKLIDG